MDDKTSSPLRSRPPIIAVLGHVDHGKTSLLDAIRSTNVQAGETGGITQHIGAYQIVYNHHPLTFIDTPGHAAFTSMRARGGQTADLAILVVAADDGVMPQTKESIAHINSANIPYIVALNKIDLPQAQTDRVKTQLVEAGVLVEGYGGNVPIVEVSATRKTNLDLLLENLLLLAELQELKADPEGTLEAIVIESTLDKHQGPLATVILKNGSLAPGQDITTVPNKPQETPLSGRVRALTDWQGQPVPKAIPSTPCRILGFSQVPPVGSIITHKHSLSQFSTKTQHITQTEINSLSSDQSQQGILLKTDVVGTLEAISHNLPEKIHLVHAGAGAISESDILLAQTSSVPVYGFRTKPTPSAKKLAQIEHIPIHTFDTIYDLLDHLQLLSTKTISKHQQETINGQATIIKIFNLPQSTVFGCKSDSGVIKTGDQVHLKRSDGSSKNARITSLKIGSKDVSKVSPSQEFGLVLTPQLDAKPGDQIISFSPPPVLI